MRPKSIGATTTGLIVAIVCIATSGCHDGPLYGLKQANPYFVLREWKQDKAYGVTDHERCQELQSLASQIGSMNATDQASWAKHLDRMIKTDPSPEMRRLSILAASRLKTADSLALIEQGLDDESLKVQMEACSALGRRPEAEAAQLLASTIGTTPERDVKNSAVAALASHKGNVPVDSLRLVLEDSDPATVDLAMTSLRGVTGKDLGTDAQQWIAAIDQMRSQPTSPATPGADNPQVQIAEGEPGTSIFR